MKNALIGTSAIVAMFAVAPLVALLVCAQGCGPTAPPRDYYFSPRGSDADGLGTPERPYGSR